MSESLFDFERVRSAPDSGFSQKDAVLTVSRLNTLVKNNLEQVFGEVSVKGEISNVTIPTSGHAYFTLKDEDAEISAVWFRSGRIRSGIELNEGDAVVIKGSVSLYEPRGTYQIMVRSVSAEGKGDLREQFEQLARKLRDEGLFDEHHKKPLPLLPETIGIITSKTGAAVRDITNVIWGRFPGAHVILGPVRVQGKEAPGEISRMIALFNSWGKADVLIVGRGGGSLEDLWAFNEEEVARAIFNSHTPVVSAVGHEIDVTISDLTADVRALTPTKAGELVVPDVMQENQRLDLLLNRSRLSVTHALSSMRDELERYKSHRIFAAPQAAIKVKLARSVELARRLISAGNRTYEIQNKTLHSYSGILESLNPLSVLKRGFSYTEKNSRPITDAKDIAIGDTVTTRLYQGSIISNVTDKKERDNG